MWSLLLACSPPTPSAPADVVYTDATFWVAPGEQTDALAVRDGRIAALGAEALAMEALRTEPLGGAFVTPGLHDAHTHLFAGSFVKPRILLQLASTMDGVAGQVASYAASHPDEPWLIGFGWTSSLEDPDGRGLDAVAPDRPVLLIASSGHAAIANPYALALAGIGDDTPDPPGGTIVRDPTTGEATGLLLEAAVGPVVEPALAAYDDEAVLPDLRAELDAAAASGLTSLSEILAAPGVDLVRPQLFRDLDRAGELPLRVHFFVPVREAADLEGIDDWRAFESDRVRFAGAKVWVDGSLAGEEAWTLGPWASGDNGSSYVDEAGLTALIAEAEARGVPLKVHAMGDAALEAVLGAFEAQPALSLTHSVEHASLLTEATRARFADLGLVASVQPLSRALTPFAGWDDALPSWEADASYDFAALLDAGAPLAIGTDYPTVPVIDPLVTLGAVRDDARPGAISVEAALEGFTAGSGRSAGLGGMLGCMEVGCIADLTVFADDPIPDPAESRVLTTLLAE
ncbi:MAG: amidohydrolase [Alphaproteobacteria bacterium]|nr:amidohydrolase [Alphaproteobacteria bacterium]